MTEATVKPAGDITADIIPEPRRVPFDAPWEWLAAGWRDVWAVPGISLTYGAAFALAALVLCLGLMRIEAVSLFLALAGGFLLIGPFLAVGLYEASRRMKWKDQPRFRDVMWSWLSARGQLGFFGVVLMFVFMVWMQIAFLLAMGFLGGQALPPPEQFMHMLLFTPRGLGLLIAGTIVGGLLAVAVFSMSALAVPLLLDRRVDVVSAVKASLSTVAKNPKPMALWAALIVVIMAAGFAMLLVGLAVAFPLIGHATWHAYEDIFGERKS